MHYECLYCGKKIGPDDVLFVDETNTVYDDPIRKKIQEDCGMIEAGETIKYHRLYHRVKAENVKRRDVNGFPFTICARPCDGLTADELVQEHHSADASAQEIAAEPENTTKSSSFGSQAYSTSGVSAFNQSADASDTDKPSSKEVVTLSTRVCPHCHCNLPQDFGLLPVHSVQIVGGRASGKTAFLICLHQQLNRQLSMNELGTATLLDESELYLRPKVEYYEEYAEPKPTKAKWKIFPLVYRITTKAYGDKKRKEAFVSFHDVAGEGMTSGDYLHNLAGLSRSHNLLYIIDPNQLNDGGYHTTYTRIMGGRSQAVLDIKEADQDDVLSDGDNMDFYQTELGSDIDNIGRAVLGVFGERELNNIFVVMTKIDMPLMVETDMFGRGNMLMMNDIGEIHKGIINGDALNRIDTEVNLFVSAKTNSDRRRKLTESIAASFQCEEDKIHLCCISTHTRVEDPQNRRIMFANNNDPGAPKHRIIEPFLCILYHIGLLPAKYRDRDEVDWQGDSEKEEHDNQKNKKKKTRRSLFGKAK